jgi:hypothetical protein
MKKIGIILTVVISLGQCTPAQAARPRISFIEKALQALTPPGLKKRIATQRANKTTARSLLKIIKKQQNTPVWPSKH